PLHSITLPYTTLFRSKDGDRGLGFFLQVGIQRTGGRHENADRIASAMALDGSDRLALLVSWPIRCQNRDRARSFHAGLDGGICRSEEHTSELQSRENL